MSRTLEILETLVGFPTVSAQSNLDLIDFAQALLQDAGFAVTRLPAPCGRKAGLHARIGPGEGGICLSAHSDVVPVDGQDWSHPPFALTREGGRVHGRGTTDMKGFLASALALAERAGDAALTAPLSLVLSHDEEIGCVGIRQMMPALAPLLGQPRLVIVGEPTGMRVATGHKGKVALEVTCHGQSGHSALAPHYVNAIHLAADIVHEVRVLQDKLALGPSDSAYAIAHATLHVGRIEGGRALNIVPEIARLEMELRHLARQPAHAILSQLRSAAAAVAATHGADAAITIEQTNAYPGLETPPEAAAVATARALAGQAELTKVAFGTEAGFFSDRGLDTVVLGPGDMARDGHKPDEGLALTQLSQCDAMMLRILSMLRDG